MFYFSFGFYESRAPLSRQRRRIRHRMRAYATRRITSARGRQVPGASRGRGGGGGNGLPAPSRRSSPEATRSADSENDRACGATDRGCPAGSPGSRPRPMSIPANARGDRPASVPKRGTSRGVRPGPCAPARDLVEAAPGGATGHRRAPPEERVRMSPRPGSAPPFPARSNPASGTTVIRLAASVVRAARVSSPRCARGAARSSPGSAGPIPCRHARPRRGKEAA